MRRTASGIARDVKKIADHLRRERDRAHHDAWRRQHTGDRKGARTCRRLVARLDRWVDLLASARIRVVMDGRHG